MVRIAIEPWIVCLELKLDKVDIRLELKLGKIGSCRLKFKCEIWITNLHSIQEKIIKNCWFKEFSLNLPNSVLTYSNSIWVNTWATRAWGCFDNSRAKSSSRAIQLYCNSMHLGIFFEVSETCRELLVIWNLGAWSKIISEANSLF